MPCTRAGSRKASRRHRLSWRQMSGVGQLRRRSRRPARTCRGRSRRPTTASPAPVCAAFHGGSALPPRHLHQPVEEHPGRRGRVDQLRGGAPPGHRPLLEQSDRVQVVADPIMRKRQGFPGHGPLGVVQLPALRGSDQGGGAVVGVVEQRRFGQGDRDPDRRPDRAETTTQGDTRDDRRVHACAGSSPARCR